MDESKGSSGLTIVVADRPRSHEVPAGVPAAIGVDSAVEFSVSMAGCRREIVDGEFNERNEQRPIRLVTISDHLQSSEARLQSQH